MSARTFVTLVVFGVAVLDGLAGSAPGFLEWYALDRRQKASAAAVAAVVMDEDVICVPEGCTIARRPIPEACGAMDVGTDARIIERGTAFLIDRNHVITAGHVLAANHLCAAGASARAFRFVFDFRMEREERVAEPAAEDIYAGDEVVSCSIAPGQDVAIVRLRDAASHREPLRLRRNAPQSGERIWSLGHPLGLPLKYTQGTLVDSTGQFLHGRLTASYGSSGAPVFDSEGAVFGLITSMRVPAAVAKDGCAAIEHCAGTCLTSISRVR